MDPRSSPSAEFGHLRCCFLQRTTKKCTKNYNARAQPTGNLLAKFPLLLPLLFS